MIESLPRTAETTTTTPPVLPDVGRTTVTLSRNMRIALAALDKVFEEYPKRIRFAAESRSRDA